jgi:hypothetical protein
MLTKYCSGKESAGTFSFSNIPKTVDPLPDIAA